MKIVESWLREFVEPPFPIEEVARRLTMAGIEVGAVERAGPPLDGIIVGSVIHCGPHPNADRLSVCRVDVGDGRQRQIVCGASNVRAGLKVAVALPGTVMPDGTELGQAKLRGVESEGMICSGRELQLNDDHAGILELASDAKIGEPVARAMSLDETVMAFDLTPNRGDCLSVIGVAREVAALSARPTPVIEVEAAPTAHRDTVPVRIEDKADCAVFCGRVVRGVDAMRASPLWLQERLRRVGIRPLGVAVDVTALVMLETGQPMHVYDLTGIAGGIHVRRGATGESVELLDGKSVEVDAEVLVIADRKRVLGLAGIIGGATSAVGNGTRDVYLEAAHFSPGAVAGRARRFGLHTDAAQRFERGVDPALPPKAIEYATRLLTDIAGGEAGPVKSAGRVAPPMRSGAVTLRRARLAQVYGGEYTDVEVVRVLSGLGFSVRKARGGWRVRVPSWRFDVEREEDLIEEVARSLGYGRIPARDPVLPTSFEPAPESAVSPGRLADTLVARGYHEVITYSFVDPAAQARLGLDAGAIALANPIAPDMAQMRTGLWPGLLDCLAHNAKRQCPRVRIFECGLRFVEREGELEQRPLIAGLGWGDRQPAQWGMTEAATDFHDVKTDCEALLTGVAGTVRFRAAQHPALHPGQAARIEVDGIGVGWIGTLHPAAMRAFDLPSAPVVFELELDAVEGRMPVAEPVSRLPGLRRDLALVVDEAVRVADLLDAVDAIAPEWLRDRFIFDIYRGPGIEAGRKSVALGLILQETSRTLTDGEADAFLRRLVDHLRDGVGATLRE